MSQVSFLLETCSFVMIVPIYNAHISCVQIYISTFLSLSFTLCIFEHHSIEEKITSLDANLAEIKTNVVHWHRLTSVMRHELNLVQEKKDMEEANLRRLHDKLKVEERTLESTKEDFNSLDKMKSLLEYRIMVVKDAEQKEQLGKMLADTSILMKAKSRALTALETVKESYDTAISDKREILFLHSLLEHVHETLIEWQEGMNSNIWAPSEILLACVEHESRNDALRKTQHLRLKSLMETNELVGEGNNTRRRGRGGGGGDDDNSTGTPDDVVQLKRKLAQITAEKEEIKRRMGKPEWYQISCRDCNSGTYERFSLYN